MRRFPRTRQGAQRSVPVYAVPSGLRGPAARPTLARRWHLVSLRMGSQVRDRHSRSAPREHSRIPSRHDARLAPRSSRPFRSCIPGSAQRRGPSGSRAPSGRQPGPGTRGEAPRRRPGRALGGVGVANLVTWGPGRGRHGCGGGAGAGSASGVSDGVGGSLTWGAGGRARRGAVRTPQKETRRKR